MRQPLDDSPHLPSRLRTKYAAWDWHIAWQYGPEALTYRLTDSSGEVRFLKLLQGDSYPTLEDERVRMEWARTWLPVPQVIEADSEGETGWLLTSGLPGSDATDPEWTADPERLTRILARGLRRFHAVPASGCPFDFTLASALAHVRRRLVADHIRPQRDFHPEFEHLSARDAVRLLERTLPDSEDLVVCHGDYCPPNIMIDRGEATGFVDLGELGVADRWWDLSVATWSLTWNLGPGYEALFLEEYGVEPDGDRIRFYRLLYDLVS